MINLGLRQHSHNCMFHSFTKLRSSLKFGEPTTPSNDPKDPWVAANQRNKLCNAGPKALEALTLISGHSREPATSCLNLQHAWKSRRRPDQPHQCAASICPNIRDKTKFHRQASEHVLSQPYFILVRTNHKDVHAVLGETNENLQFMLERKP